jgi:hypothetical protein
MSASVFLVALYGVSRSGVDCVRIFIYLEIYPLIFHLEVSASQLRFFQGFL